MQKYGWKDCQYQIFLTILDIPDNLYATDKHLILISEEEAVNSVNLSDLLSCHCMQHANQISLTYHHTWPRQWIAMGTMDTTHRYTTLWETTHQKQVSEAFDFCSLLLYADLICHLYVWRKSNYWPLSFNVIFTTDCDGNSTAQLFQNILFSSYKRLTGLVFKIFIVRVKPSWKVRLAYGIKFCGIKWQVVSHWR